MTTRPELLSDLEAEYLDLHHLVERLPPDAGEWDMATPAVGWAVRDQISHLAFFDDAARMALVEPALFTEAAERAMASDGDPMEAHLTRGRSIAGNELLLWWDHAHTGMAAALVGAEPTARVPWYGPAMGLMSFASARLMETWAHGQDVADALDRHREPTDRLRHVAHLGVRARPFSYLVHGQKEPPGSIDVSLVAPSGARWAWQIGVAGEDDSSSASIEGPALDFCLVVTQRRNVVDTELAVTGASAAEWMALAQAFAGPPGPGRPPISVAK
jgi:uncharacterized protein (TIGR03084 family)